MWTKKKEQPKYKSLSLQCQLKINEMDTFGEYIKRLRINRDLSPFLILRIFNIFVGQ